MPDRSGLWGMPLYLGVATVCNVVFLRSALRDKLARREPASMTTGLLAMAIAELIWVVPCFIQCLLVFIEGRGGYGSWFSPPNEPGCQIQGWYSVMSSLSSMAGTAQMAYLTWRASCTTSPATSKSTTVATLCLFAATLLLTTLPVLGIGEYKSSGEGFCYIDWRDGWHVAFVNIVLVPSTIAVVLFFTKVMLSDASDNKSNMPQRPVWLLYIGYFGLTWCLWYVGTVHYFSKDEFPKGIMITGGVLGHLTAMVHPLIYGIYYRRWFLVGSSKIEPKAELGVNIDEHSI